MRKHLLVPALLLLPCVGLHAQEGAQTVENAQKFIALTLPDNRYVPGDLFHVLDEAKKVGGAAIRGTGRITDANALARCRSRILFDMSAVTMEGWPSGRPSQSKMYYLPDTFPDAYPKWGTNKEGFSWGDVKEVKAEGTDVILLFKGGLAHSRIYLGAETLASRVAYAIEFLRTSCDAAAGTGF
ncbi:hypothetical protein [Pseudoxanthomonas japonensis]|uniref:Uncharacterized protein n=1 Tax=Pseudoxanthomonas japonensis TaxID=69284 RepID=A0ABQ6ZDH3_9GAMM|nr:hypothetical protein [Pseudoxanthomonas japonensis]KAF1723362.1 hypothetical protein CSC78_16345 [Pseudoxanthomonas japonensis]